MVQREGIVVATHMTQPAQSGELWALVGVLAYAVAYIFDRAAMINADPLIGPLMLGFPSLVMGVLLLLTQKTYRQLQPGTQDYVGRRAIMVFIIAGILSTLGVFTYYFALQIGGVTITIPVQQTFIIWGAIAGWLYLGERYSRNGLIGVGILVAGLILLGFGQTRGIPVSRDWYYAIPLALFTAMSYGISGVFWREGQLRGADQSVGIFLQFITSEIIALLGLLLFGRVETLFKTSGYDLGKLFVSGVLSGVIGVYCLFTSLKLMSVTRTYALFSLIPLVAVVLAYLFLKENINWQMMIGILLGCFGVMLIQVFKTNEGVKEWKVDAVKE